MKNISSLKTDLEFNKSLSFLIKTLKTIAVAQFRTLERKTSVFENLLLVSESFFEFINIKDIDHPFLQTGNKPQIVAAITSDKGLLGGQNMQIISAAIRELEKAPGKLIIIGERGKMYVRGRGISTVCFPGISDDEKYIQALQVRDHISKEVLSGLCGSVKVIYPRPVSFTVQRIETVTFLPFLPKISQTGNNTIANVIMESSSMDIVEYLVYLWMGQKLYEIFGLSRLAEFAARFIHLERSEQKLEDIQRKLRLQYFRVRHEMIDCTMRELFAGRLRHA